MDLEMEEYGDVVVCRLKGRLDAVSAFDFQERLQNLTTKGVCRLIINLRGVSYLSSAAIRLLLSFTKQLSSMNGGLCICGICGQVKEVLEVSGFDKILKICINEQECFNQL